METKNENNNKGNMTLDGLARIVQGEFRVIGERMDKIENEIDGMKIEMDGMKIGMNELKDEVIELREETREKSDLILSSEDKTAKILEDLKADNVMGAEASRRQEDKLENHEERIGTVEGKLNIALPVS